MKLLLLVLLTLVSNYQSKIFDNTCNVEMDSTIDLKIELTHKNKVIFVFKNNFKSKIYLSDPTCYVNWKIELKEEGRNIRPALRIKPDINCVKSMVVLFPGQEKKFVFPYSVTKLYDVEKKKNYEIEFQYIGGIIDHCGDSIEYTIKASKNVMIQ